MMLGSTASGVMSKSTIPVGGPAVLTFWLTNAACYFTS
ncbi:MAG: hypothetical protein LC657_07670 [Desulfobacteraceae bacterium]|nr:hypothetical protein [Desulfobacteraceae bacterium]